MLLGQRIVKGLSRFKHSTMAAVNGDKVLDSVKEYYGKTLQSQGDLQVPACLSPGVKVSKPVSEAIGMVHDEVASRYYGCGLVIPPKLEGMKVLDLGSGTGRDCYAISKLVGEGGHVTGVDMTDEQISLARKYIDYHTKKFGYSKPNIDFVQGYIEKLTEAGLKENNFDIIISNCVINLSPDKKAVLGEAYKVLNVGGELYFSDIYADRDVPEEARKHEVLWGECISGALWWKDLYTLAKENGFSQPRLVTARQVPIDRDDFKQILGDAQFASITYRLFKLPQKLEEATQVIYNGEISGFEKELKFDHNYTFKRDEPLTVDSELATILKCSRFGDEFEFQPASKKSCCPSQSADLDPFVYIAELEAKGEKQEAPACCAPGKKCC